LVKGGWGDFHINLNAGYGSVDVYDLSGGVLNMGFKAG
jgi:hypothetical protein